MSSKMRDPSNIVELRLVWAESGLQGYNDSKGGGDEDQTDIPDLIADLLHLAVSKDLDPEAMLLTARINFEAEK